MWANFRSFYRSANRTALAWAAVGFVLCFVLVGALWITWGVTYGDTMDDIDDLKDETKLLYVDTYGISCGHQYCNVTTGLLVKGILRQQDIAIFLDLTYFNNHVGVQDSVLRVAGPQSMLIADRGSYVHEYEVSEGCVIQGQTVSLATNDTGKVIAGHTSFSEYELLNSTDAQSLRNTAVVSGDTYAMVYRNSDQAWAVCYDVTSAGIVYGTPIAISAAGYGGTHAELSVEGGFTDGTSFVVAYNDPASSFEGVARLCSCNLGACGAAYVYRPGVSTIVSDLTYLDDTHILIVHSDTVDLDAEVLVVTAPLTLTSGSAYTIDALLVGVDERPATCHYLGSGKIGCEVGDGLTTNIYYQPIAWDLTTVLTIGTPQTILPYTYVTVYHQSALVGGDQLVITLEANAANLYDSFIVCHLFLNNNTLDSCGPITHFSNLPRVVDQVFLGFSESADVVPIGTDDSFLIASRTTNGGVAMVGRLDGDGGLVYLDDGSMFEGLGTSYPFTDGSLIELTLASGTGSNLFTLCMLNDLSGYSGSMAVTCVAGERLGERELDFNVDNRGPQVLGMAMTDGCQGDTISVIYHGVLFHPSAQQLCYGPQICSHSDGFVDSSCSPRQYEADGELDSPIVVGRCISPTEIFINVHALSGAGGSFNTH